MNNSEDSSKDFLSKAINQLAGAVGAILTFGVSTLPPERADAICRAREANTLTFGLTLDFQPKPKRWTALCNLVDGDGVSTSLDLGELAHGLFHPPLFLVKRNTAGETEEKS